MAEASAARQRREPAFAGFLPAPSHPLRRQLTPDGPRPPAIDGVIDPPPGDRREPRLGMQLPLTPHPLRREPFYRRVEERERLRGPAGSAALHGLILAVLLIGWHNLPAPEPPPIPVQLVVEIPKPPPAPPAPPAPSPRGPLASEDMGDTATKPVGPTPVEAPSAPTPPAGPPVPPAPPIQLVAPQPAPVPPPPPLELPQLAALPPPPLPQPKPPPPPRPPARIVSRPAAMTLRQAKMPGPAATKDEYLAYAFAMVRRHFYLLPRSQIGDRRGEAVVGFVVHDDGSVSQLSIDRSSGYADIDRKAAEMIVAVGRFPPLPQWFQGEAVRLEFHLEFPTASE